MANEITTHGRKFGKAQGRRVLVALSHFGARLRRDPATRKWVLDMPITEGCDLKACGVTAHLLTRLTSLVGGPVRVRLTTATGIDQHEFEIHPAAELPPAPDHGRASREVVDEMACAPDDGPLIRAYLAACYRSSSRQQPHRIRVRDQGRTS